MLQNYERIKPLSDDQIVVSLELCDGQPVEPFDELQLPQKLPGAVIEVAGIAMRDALLTPGQAHVAAIVSLAEVLYTSPSSDEPLSSPQVRQFRHSIDPLDTELCDQGDTAMVVRPRTDVVLRSEVRHDIPMPLRVRSYKIRRAPLLLGPAHATISGSLEGLNHVEHDKAFRSLAVDAMPFELPDAPPSSVYGALTTDEIDAHDAGQPPFGWFVIGELDVSGEPTKRNIVPLTLSSGGDETARVEPLVRPPEQELADGHEYEPSEHEHSLTEQERPWWRSISSIIKKVRGK